MKSRLRIVDISLVSVNIGEATNVLESSLMSSVKAFNNPVCSFTLVFPLIAVCSKKKNY